jgi:hypothetical protein
MFVIPRVPGCPCRLGGLWLESVFRLAAEDVRFQPVVVVQTELLIGPGRHPVTVLVEARLGLLQPEASLLVLPEALLGKSQPEYFAFSPSGT